MTPFSVALRRGDYELAALRLLLAVAQTLRETAPDAREDLLDLLLAERPEDQR
jgi:hypothetical protein